MTTMSAAEVLAKHQYSTGPDAFCECGHETTLNENTDMAAHQISSLRAAGYAVVRVPDIAHKGPHDTNGSMLITAAEKAESARYPVGGSNVGRAVAQVLREVAAAAD